MQLNWLKKKRKLDARKREKQRLRHNKRRRLNPSSGPSHLFTNYESNASSKPRETFVQKYSRMLEEQKRKEEEDRLRAEKEMQRQREDNNDDRTESMPLSLDDTANGVDVEGSNSMNSLNPINSSKATNSSLN